MPSFTAFVLCTIDFSAGIGRTGIFIAADILATIVETHNCQVEVDVFSLVQSMMTCRPDIIQTQVRAAVPHIYTSVPRIFTSYLTPMPHTTHPFQPYVTRVTAYLTLTLHRPTHTYTPISRACISLTSHLFHPKFTPIPPIPYITPVAPVSQIHTINNAHLCHTCLTPIPSIFHTHTSHPYHSYFTPVPTPYQHLTSRLIK